MFLIVTLFVCPREMNAVGQVDPCLFSFMIYFFITWPLEWEVLLLACFQQIVTNVLYDGGKQCS